MLVLSVELEFLGVLVIGCAVDVGGAVLVLLVGLVVWVV